MTATTAKAFWITGAGKGELRAETLREPGAGEARVRTLYSAVSRGTECLVLRGDVPESEAQNMRAPFQEGDFPWPVKYGYSAVGIVEEGPESLRGQNVFCLHPHQTRFVVPETALTTLPRDLPPSRAVLAANMETAVNALWDAAPLAGERIAVIGAGVVGTLVAALAARVPGVALQLIDTDSTKAAIANAFGLTFATPDVAAGDVDLVIHASGNPLGLETALALAGFEGRIVELSWYGTKRANIALGAAFHSRRLRLISSQVGHIGGAMRGRRSHAERMRLALELLRDPVFDALITGEDDFSALPLVLPRIAANNAVLCHRIVYDS